MPHIVVEYSRNCEALVKQTQLLQHLHEITVESGLFSAQAVKARGAAYDDFTLPEGLTSFVHITISILEGRPLDKRVLLSDSLFNKMQELLPNIDKISVNIDEMIADTYRKN